VLQHDASMLARRIGGARIGKRRHDAMLPL
jgi:hypothetical protein